MCSLPRLIDIKEDNGEITPGVYPAHMTDIIGEGAYDSEGHMNTQLLWATEIGPHPMEMQHAWEVAREEAAYNYGMQGEQGSDQ
jgi:hypothetical protein